MRKILTSLGMVVFAGAVIVGATGAFFSDTETSTGNVFAAGAIDLQIDNESYVTDVDGNLVFSSSTSWDLDDLTGHLFFNFSDLKPGDIGEDTISIHVNNNDAWLCAAAQITEDSDVSYTEPELDDDTTVATGTPLTTDGELAEELNFAFWADDGDNVLETDEAQSIFLAGPISALGGSGQIALADSQGGPLGPGPIPGGQTVYIGKAWCFGDLTAAPLAPGEDLSPLNGTGFTCDGELVNNAAQTDRVMGDLQFYAEQSRNNSTFTCAEDFTPDFPDGEQRVEVGADLATYVAPTGGACNITVDDSFGPDTSTTFNTIQEGVNASVAGNTVCVNAGTYSEDVSVNKDITLAGAGSGSTNIIGQTSGEAGAVVITADGATVQGFNITEATGGVAALRISGAHTGITVDSNTLNGATGGNAFLTDGGQSNHTISNNVINGVAGQPIAYVNGLASVNVASTNVDFTQNTFGGAGNLALGQEAGASSITLNKFSAVTGFTDIEDWGAGNLINQNNFNDAINADVLHSENGNTGDTGTTNAENNWWGDANPADGDAGADVDFTPFEVAAFPEN